MGLDCGVVAPGLEHDERSGIVPGHAQVVGEIAIFGPLGLHEFAGKGAELLNGIGTDAERGDNTDHGALLTLSQN